jgi:O-acetyl-ADP-ribose deacetylase (regulator of RNase III)
MEHSFQLQSKVIKIMSGDITMIESDCIVSSDDNYLSMSGGVSHAIKQAGGAIVWNESRQYAPAALTSVHVTSAGNLKAKYVLHTIVIDFDQWLYPNIEMLQKALLNTLNKAEALGCYSISLPAFGTGAGALDSNLSAVAVIDTLFKLLPKYTNLTVVNVVLYRADTLFHFFELAIQKRYKLEYETQIQQLEKEKESLVKLLKAESRYKNLPFPIAYLKRLTDENIIQHSKFTSQIDFFEQVVKFLTLIVCAELYNHQKNPTAQTKVQVFFERDVAAGFGTWTSFLDDLLKENHNVLFSNKITKNIHDFFRSQNHGLIKDVIKIRNSVPAHGTTKNEFFYKDLIDNILEPKLNFFFSDLAFFNDLFLIVVQEIDYDDDETILYKYSKIVGDSLIFPTASFKSKTIRLAKNNLYLIHKEFDAYVKLAPFMVYEGCKQCCTIEPFYLEKISKQKCFYVKQRGDHKFESEPYRKKFA